MRAMRAGICASLGVSVLSLGACVEAVAPPELGTPYEASLAATPVPDEDPCSVVNGSGLAVTCGLSFTVGGEVRGLEGKGLSIVLNGWSELSLDADGAFEFSGALPVDAKYAVSVVRAPSQPMQACAVTSGQGRVSGGAVTDILIDCATVRLSLGGTVTGLEGKLILRSHTGEEIQIAQDGPFAFDTGVQSGADYEVWVEEQPKEPEQICVVTNGSGTAGDADIKDIQVDCKKK